MTSKIFARSPELELLRSYHCAHKRRSLAGALFVTILFPFVVVIEAGKRLSHRATSYDTVTRTHRSLLSQALIETKIAVSYAFIGRDMMK
jgi:hypothetical protein